MEKLKAIRDLRAQAQGLDFGEHTALDAFERRGKMVLRNLFGEDSRWLREFNAIWLVATGLRTIEGEMDDWKRGRAQYVNLFATLEEELTSFGDCENQLAGLVTVSQKTSEEVVELRPNFYGIGINLRALWRKLRGRIPRMRKTGRGQ